MLFALALLLPGPSPRAEGAPDDGADTPARAQLAVLRCLTDSTGDPLAAYRCLRRELGPLDGDIECLRATYGEQIEAVEPDPETGRPVVVMKGGARIDWDDGQRGKTFDELLDRPDLSDQLSIAYPVGPDYEVPGVDDDPGRVRSEPFFKAVYGATPAEVKQNLVTVDWTPSRSGQRLKFNRRNGAAAALERVAAELAQLPPKLKRYVETSAGTFNWRKIAGTRRLSVHSFAIAVDVDVKHSDYWRWVMKNDPSLAYRNRIPVEIAEVFERHGFVWGGKWYHFDTMHFEYRPEMLHPLCVR